MYIHWHALRMLSFQCSRIYTRRSPARGRPPAARRHRGRPPAARCMPPRRGLPPACTRRTRVVPSLSLTGCAVFRFSTFLFLFSNFPNPLLPYADAARVAMLPGLYQYRNLRRVPPCVYPWKAAQAAKRTPGNGQRPAAGAPRPSSATARLVKGCARSSGVRAPSCTNACASFALLCALPRRTSGHCK
ncbi:MAG: hypothetical protein J3K34DRAFT_19545 [Monoraphidium minutum]|nr:MAG: hypothetical protein J3K34DRAFT_19545 [Monoraphidium minutum]